MPPHPHYLLGTEFFKTIQPNNDVNNQQDATTFSFINLFNSALHVSGDKFAHSQERFLTYKQSKSAPEDGRICCPKHVGLN